MNSGLDGFFAGLKATMPATKVLTWEDVLKNENLIGGDIECQQSGGLYRAPISKIYEDNNHVYFESPWRARFNAVECQWQKWDVLTCYVDKLIVPQDIGDGRIFFVTREAGPWTLFPKGGSKLDSHKVEGLPKGWERFLALYPDLKFDREIAERVLIDKTFVRARAELEKYPGISTVPDLLGCFTRDDSREEFLWHYVEAMTDEKNVHQKVY